MTTVQPASNPCFEIFARPFKEGALNIRDAFAEKRVNLVAQNILPGPAPAPADQAPSLGKRVACLAIGVLLIIPVINMVVMAILRNVNNDFLHSDTTTPVPPNPMPMPPGPIPMPPIPPNPMPPGPNPLPPGPNPPPPGPNPPPPGPNPPPPGPNPPPLPPRPEEILQRKEAAAERLEEIEAMVAANEPTDPFETLANKQNGHFQCHPNLAQFDLDAFLAARFATNAHPIGLTQFRDWADVEHDGTWLANDQKLERVWGMADGNYLTAVNRNNYEDRRETWFRDKLNEICDENLNLHMAQFPVARRLLRNTLAYFTQQRNLINEERAHVVPGTPEAVALNAKEAALKEDFRTFYISFIDASHNCIDQVISQLEPFILNVAVRANGAQGAVPFEQKIFNQACLALYKYRTEMLTTILLRQDLERAEQAARAEAIARGLDPNVHAAQFVEQFREQEMADVQRMAVQQLADPEHLNLRGALANVGAAFENHDPVRRARATAGVDAFMLRYNPNEYLLSGVAQPVIDDPRAPVSTLLTEWAMQHYALQNEDPNGPQLDRRLAGAVQDDDFSVTEGGVFTAAATALLLEKAGLFVTRANPV